MCSSLSTRSFAVSNMYTPVAFCIETWSHVTCSSTATVIWKSATSVCPVQTSSLSWHPRPNWLTISLPGGTVPPKLSCPGNSTPVLSMSGQLGVSWLNWCAVKCSCPPRASKKWCTWSLSWLVHPQLTWSTRLRTRTTKSLWESCPSARELTLTNCLRTTLTQMPSTWSRRCWHLTLQSVSLLNRLCRTLTWRSCMY